jgi:gliotoxin/aspirochlorine biosynthesis thioredoxin reductase
MGLFATNTESPVDILIIGGGVAGLSAAAAVVRQDHTVVIIDSQKYRNAGSLHMHTLATWDHRNPVDWRAAARKDFERYGTVTIENREVDKVMKVENGLFKATSKDGQEWTTKKVILATGVEDVFPSIPGYAESWITGMLVSQLHSDKRLTDNVCSFHCLYCHGWEEKGTPSSGILAEGECAAVLPALHFARQALRISSTVTIYTHGSTQLADDITKALKTSPAPMKVDSREITKLEKGPERSEIVLYFLDGTSLTEGFLAHKPNSKLRGDLHEQLGLEMGPKGTVVAKPPFNQSSIKGVFVAGDMASPMQTVTMAQAMGTSTGAGAPLQIQAEMWNQTPLF